MCFRTFISVLVLLGAVVLVAESKYHKNEGRRRHIRHQHRHTPQDDNNLEDRKYPAEELLLPDSVGKDKDPIPEEGEAEEGESQDDRWNSYTPSHSNLCPMTSCNSDFQMSILVRLRQIQDQFLKESGLDKPPNMTGVVISQNPYLRSLIHNTNAQESVNPKHKRRHDGGDEEGMAYSDDPNTSIKNEKVFITASTERPDFFKLPEEDLVIYFNLTKEHISSIEYAYVHLWIRPTNHLDQEHNVATASIYKIEASPYHDYPRLREYYGGIEVPYERRGSWVKIDIYLLARDWIFHPESNYGMTVVLNTAHNKYLTFDTAGDEPSHAPLLELDVVEERNDRRKRYASNRVCTDKKIEKICCRYPLIVNFVDFQWDFIVAPKRYEANYCRGDCPFVFAQKYPHSTLLQKKFNNTNSTHGPCCGARVLDPLRMVYYDGAKIKVSTIKDMVVKQCSCT